MTEEQFDEWLQTQPIEDKIVYLKYKYDYEDEWTFSNEMLEVDMTVNNYYIWSDDWKEGQQDVEILGCIAISDIDVPVFTQADILQTEPMKTADYCDICKQDMCEFCIADASNPYCVPSHYEIKQTEQTETKKETQNSNDKIEKSDYPWK